MKTIYLISCCKEKLPYKSKAEYLYQSEGFKRRLAFARAHNPDSILILSGKHHIVDLDQDLEPYDLCLCNQSIGEQKAWAEICLYQLSKRFDLKNDKFVILSVEDYYKYLVGQCRIENYELPFEKSLEINTKEATNFSLLKDFLFKSKKAYCDDCLSMLTGVTPRQQINQICNRNSRTIHRIDYGKCSNCCKYKIVRSFF